MSDMTTPKRSTIYFEPEVHRAVRLKAAAMDASMSDVVNEAVRRSLSEDAADLHELKKRRREPTVDFESFVLSMRRRGKL